MPDSQKKYKTLAVNRIEEKDYFHRIELRGRFEQRAKIHINTSSRIQAVMVPYCLYCGFSYVW